MASFRDSLQSFLGICIRRSGPSEARVSIRESLRIFRRIESHLAAVNTIQRGNDDQQEHDDDDDDVLLPLMFESLVAQHSNQTIRFDAASTTRSCGLTSHCFASLFFSRQQMASNHHYMHTNGSDLVQLWENWNVCAHGHMCQYPIQLLGKSNKLMKNVLRTRAMSKAASLSSSLLQLDAPEELPRVIFCNMTWILLHDKNDIKDVNKNHGNDNISNNKNNSSIDDVTSQQQNVKDHQWAVIKHDNDCFQIVQGYIDFLGNTNGYCLSDWQNQIRHTDQGGRFTSRNGFSNESMSRFLMGLKGFAASPTFDAASHMSLFGVYHHESDNVAVWPSVSFREMTDDSIDGHGCRFVAHGIEHAIFPFGFTPKCTTARTM